MPQPSFCSVPNPVRCNSMLSSKARSTIMRLLAYKILSGVLIACCRPPMIRCGCMPFALSILVAWCRNSYSFCVFPNAKDLVNKVVCVLSARSADLFIFIEQLQISIVCPSKAIASSKRGLAKRNRNLVRLDK